MKANELRIGNLVLSQWENGKIHKIKATDLLDLEQGMDPESFQPIPLTEEWLLRMGFVVTDKNDYYEFYDLDRLMVFVGIQTKSIFATWNDCQIEITIDDLPVHKLQNLTFALTGEELTCK